MESSASRSPDRLLVRAREGSRSALDQLMGSCRPWLRDRVRARLPREVARKQDGSDFVQECLYKAAAQFSRFEGRTPGEFRAWMAGILERRVFRALRFWGQRRRDQRREVPLGPAWSDGGELAEAETSILGRLSRDEESERLRLAASWCREEDRAVIDMHLFEGRTHDEIADELGLTGAAARQRYCRAVRRVGEAMRLLELMARRGMTGLQQDAIGLHRFRGATPGQVADLLRLPRELVTRWIGAAQPLLRAIAKDEP
jgi:RNA polymerase sigma-70 factor (ECF subfamily)